MSKKTPVSTSNKFKVPADRLGSTVDTLHELFFLADDGYCVSVKQGKNWYRSPAKWIQNVGARHLTDLVSQGSIRRYKRATAPK